MAYYVMEKYQVCTNGLYHWERKKLASFLIKDKTGKTIKIRDRVNTDLETKINAVIVKIAGMSLHKQDYIWGFTRRAAMRHAAHKYIHSMTDILNSIIDC